MGKSIAVSFRMLPEDKVEWDGWRSIAEQAGQEWRDWLFTRIRQSLAPKPQPSRTVSGAAYKDGVRVGILCGQIQEAFASGHPEDWDPTPALRFAEKWPHLVPDVLSIMTAKAYGADFHHWWKEVIGPAESPTVRTLVAHR